MKETVFIVIVGILVYLGFSTIFGETKLMGSYGATFALYNRDYFGYIAFAYLFVLLYPLYKLYRLKEFTFREAEVVIASFLLFCSLLLAQALLVTNNYRGKFGADFVDFLSPYIGLFGLWIFWIIITLVAIVILLDKSSAEIVSTLVLLLKKEDSLTSPSFENKKIDDIEDPIEKDIFYEDEDEDLISIEEEIDKPAYLRHKEENTILEQKTDTDKDKKDQTNSNEAKSSVEKKNILDVAKELKEHKNTVIVEELEENKKLLDTLEKGKVAKPKNFKLPPLDFLQKPPKTSRSIDENELDDKIKYLIEKLAHFKIEGDVVRTYAGPVVSTFEFKPAANVKVSKILNYHH